MTDGNELQNHLAQYSGSEVLYHHSMVKSFTYTEGTREFAHKAGAGAYWLLDLLATEPAVSRHVLTDGFGHVRLKVQGTRALLTVSDGGKGKEEPKNIFVRRIDFTDCPECPVSKRNPDGAWSFYLEPNQLSGDDSLVVTMMLPTER